MVIVGLLVLSGCASTPKTSNSSPSPRAAAASLPADAAALAERYGLQIVSESTTLPIRLPRRLEASSDWGLKQHFLLRAGFDLSPYAGQQVQVTRYLLAERIGGKPLELWVVRAEGQLIGAYVADQVSIPGIYAVNEL